MSRRDAIESRDLAEFSCCAGLGPYRFQLEPHDVSDITVYLNSIRLEPTTDYTVQVDSNGMGEIRLVAVSFLPRRGIPKWKLTLRALPDVECPRVE